MFSQRSVLCSVKEVFCVQSKKCSVFSQRSVSVFRSVEELKKYFC